MIYCNLKGGLCNMFFQIATAKSIAIDKGTDCSFPNLINQLNYLNSENTHNPSLTHAMEYTHILRNFNANPPTSSLPMFSYPFEYAIYVLPDDNFYIDGFFQSEKYFKHNRKAIIESLKLSNSLLKKIQDKYSELLTKRTTSIHVRRGDYVSFPNHHPVQTLDYYLKAIELLKNDTDVFVVFSDDIDWCKNNFKLDNIVYIEGEKDYISLYLMSFCKNNIISNSSFSWWGAWLNENENKKVVGPNIWFGSEIKHNTGDILPEEWIKI